MIILPEVAIKIENILNGNDSEVSSELGRANNFDFKVECQGFHLDRIFNRKEGKNFIPVFISSMGGQYNPVKGIKQGTCNIPITFYYPVRFRDDFFAINEFLVDAFVGSILDYGTISGKAISNISYPEFGELVDTDMKEFKEWVSSAYGETVNVMEKWMSMTITLYLTNATSDLLWCNEIVSTLSIEGSSLDSEVLLFAQSSIQSQTNQANEQLINANEVHGFPYGVSYGSSITVYVKNNNFFNYLIAQWFAGTIQNVRLTLTTTIGSNVYTKYCFVESINMPIIKGELLTMTITFAKAGQLNA